DAHETAASAKIVERGGAHVTHAAFKPTDELIGQRAQRTFIGDAAFDAFGHGFAALAVGVVLHGGVTVGAGIHRSGGAHSTIRLKSAALEQNRFAGRFFGAGEQAADHHAGSAR